MSLAFFCYRGVIRYLGALVVAALLVISPLSHLSAATDDVSQGDTLINASIADATNLLPLLASDGASASISGLVFNGLVRYDRNVQLEGDLAERWEVSPDGLVITFHLRRDVQWHDGALFTAHDVLFTYQTLIDPQVKTPYSGDFEQVAQVEVLDEYTVRVTYREPFAPGLASWGMGMLPKHLLEHQDVNRTEYSRVPIGTGPFRFGRWKTAEQIELWANATYYEGRPPIDRYLSRIIPDASTMFLELRTGGVDLMGLTPLQYHRLTGGSFWERTFQKFRYPSFGYTYLGFNLQQPPFDDRRVRWAINYAVDKEEIIRGVLMGLGVVATGPFLPASWAYNSSVAAAPYDPPRAKMLLAEAGWSDHDNDGWLDREGRLLEFTILTNQGNEQRKRAAEIVQQRLAEIGVRVKIQVVEWSSLLHEFIDHRRFEAVMLGWSLSRDPDIYDIWHSSKTGEGEFNFLGYANAEVDALLVAGRRTFDQAERQRIYRRIHELLYDDQPCLFLYVPDSLPIVQRRFRGVEQTPIGIGYNLHRWYVPLDEQRYSRWTIQP